MDKIIQRAAFEMFRDWTRIASEYYPNMDFVIKDETELVNDTKETIDKALECLFSSEKDKDREDQSWCIGYIKGFIQGNLSQCWFHKYIQTQTDKYRYIMALKSVLGYTRIDSNLGWHLDAIYKGLFNPTNLEKITFETSIDAEFVQKYDCPPNIHAGIVVQTLENLETALVKELITEPILHIPNTNYFSNEEIVSFINSH